jgi:hypothetical protein
MHLAPAEYPFSGGRVVRSTVLRSGSTGGDVGVLSKPGCRRATGQHGAKEAPTSKEKKR